MKNLILVLISLFSIALLSTCQKGYGCYYSQSPGIDAPEEYSKHANQKEKTKYRKAIVD